jgi:hypothetical protein
MILLAAAVALALPAAWGQDCAEASTTVQLAATLDAAEAAWIGADEARFLLTMEEAVLQLPCVTDPVEPSLAARYHRDLGLWLFASQQPELAQAAFAAARRVSPDQGLPLDMAPEGHPVRTIFVASSPDTDLQPAPRPVGGQVLFDGSPGDRPTQVNAIFQLEVDGSASLTQYLQPDSELPAYELWVPPPKRRPKGWHYAVGAGALAVASGSMLLGARSSQASFREDPPGTQEELDALYGRNRALSTGSAILAGTAGALGVVAVFTW